MPGVVAGAGLLVRYIWPHTMFHFQLGHTFWSNSTRDSLWVDFKDPTVGQLPFDAARCEVIRERSLVPTAGDIVVARTSLAGHYLDLIYRVMSVRGELESMEILNHIGAVWVPTYDYRVLEPLNAAPSVILTTEPARSRFQIILDDN